jgi:Effector protein
MKETAATLEQLENSDNEHIIQEGGAGRNNGTKPEGGMQNPDAANEKGTGSTITINVKEPTVENRGPPGPAGDVEVPTIASLAHELGHAGDIDQGRQSNDYSINGGNPRGGDTPPAEARATKLEQEVRKALGIPARDGYYTRYHITLPSERHPPKG